MFPSSSYNTPHGHQFGAEAAAFNEEQAIDPRVWEETRNEQTFIPTNEEREQYVAPQPVESVVQQSIVEANIAASPVEYETAAEHNKLMAQAKGYSRWMRFDRDWEKAA